MSAPQRGPRSRQYGLYRKEYLFSTSHRPWLRTLLDATDRKDIPVHEARSRTDTKVLSECHNVKGNVGRTEEVNKKRERDRRSVSSLVGRTPVENMSHCDHAPNAQYSGLDLLCTVKHEKQCNLRDIDYMGWIHGERPRPRPSISISSHSMLGTKVKEGSHTHNFLDVTDIHIPASFDDGNGHGSAIYYDYGEVSGTGGNFHDHLNPPNIPMSAIGSPWTNIDQYPSVQASQYETFFRPVHGIGAFTHLPLSHTGVQLSVGDASALLHESPPKSNISTFSELGHALQEVGSSVSSVGSEGIEMTFENTGMADSANNTSATVYLWSQEGATTHQSPISTDFTPEIPSSVDKGKPPYPDPNQLRSFEHLYWPFVVRWIEGTLDEDEADRYPFTISPSSRKIRGRNKVSGTIRSLLVCGPSDHGDRILPPGDVWVKTSFPAMISVSIGGGKWNEWVGNNPKKAFKAEHPNLKGRYLWYCQQYKFKWLKSSGIRSNKKQWKRPGHVGGDFMRRIGRVDLRGNPRDASAQDIIDVMQSLQDVQEIRPQKIRSCTECLRSRSPCIRILEDGGRTCERIGASMAGIAGWLLQSLVRYLDVVSLCKSMRLYQALAFPSRSSGPLPLAKPWSAPSVLPRKFWECLGRVRPSGTSCDGSFLATSWRFPRKFPNESTSGQTDLQTCTGSNGRDLIRDKWPGCVATREPIHPTLRSPRAQIGTSCVKHPIPTNLNWQRCPNTIDRIKQWCSVDAEFADGEHIYCLMHNSEMFQHDTSKAGGSQVVFRLHGFLGSHFDVWIPRDRDSRIDCAVPTEDRCVELTGQPCQDIFQEQVDVLKILVKHIATCIGVDYSSCTRTMISPQGGICMRLTAGSVQDLATYRLDDSGRLAKLMSPLQEGDFVEVGSRLHIRGRESPLGVKELDFEMRVVRIIRLCRRDLVPLFYFTEGLPTWNSFDRIQEKQVEKSDADGKRVHCVCPQILFRSGKRCYLKAIVLA
ncbi:hypothetical protein BV25DRAFT_1841834 [Artomyces pyxidatus]|uniref:Uncharacterized protein n=1 Tax=Artomyces pyxidatus TaxID=48021 RepID=A0ACB8SM30_9AGAM|nr:hypothetical protein BV25DRAFT_1841834 [Artomyces pyxidatus]